MTLSRDPEKARAWRARSKPLQRTGTRARSSGLRAKRLPDAERERRARVKRSVFDRDGWRCALQDLDAGPCFGPLTPHHLLKAGQGGEYEARNMVTLCASMNTWVEDEPLRAHALGLVVRRGETIEEAWAKMAAAGLVSYGPDGGPIVLLDPPTGRPPRTEAG